MRMRNCNMADIPSSALLSLRFSIFFPSHFCFCSPPLSIRALCTRERRLEGEERGFFAVAVAAKLEEEEEYPGKENEER